MDRINLLEQTGYRRLRAWAFGNPNHWQYREVGIGQLADGRWYAVRVGRGWGGAWVARDERQACEAVQAWIARIPGEWRPTPAEFDSTGQPTSGTWWQSGAVWMPGERPE